MRKRLIQTIQSVVLSFVLVAISSAQDHSAHQQPVKPDVKKPSPKKPATKPALKPAPPTRPPQPTIDHSGMDMQGEQKSKPAVDHSGMDMSGKDSGQMSMPQKSLDQVIKESPSNIVRAIGSGPPSATVPLYSLDQLENMALQKNPTLLQASAEVRAANGRRTQAGLLPNPTIGYSGEEIRGGSFGGGQHGGFVEQTFILGGKLGLSRKVAEQEINLAEIEVQEQRLRVQNSVRQVYFEVVADQERLELDRSAVTIAEEMHKTAMRLRNIGMTDPSEVLQAEIQVTRAKLEVMTQENKLRRQWKTMASIVGDPQLTQGRVDSRLDQDLPAIDQEQLVQSLLTTSPATRIAEANVFRSQAILSRARREYVPDLSVRAGLQQNRELIDGTGRRAGLQGFAEVGISIPIFNRNQGNVQAGQAELDRAKADQARVALVLRERAAAVVHDYRNARLTVDAYEKEILPKARQVYEMNLKAWGQMATSYPQVLMAQKGLYEYQSEYISALRSLRTTAISLKGFLLTDGLEAPARPGEVDMPVRELNLPSSRGTEK
ncbi:MAG TPA: TolC family protein [Terriglobales bacterium]|nr:TolC family protein [Terriglobales bacterium]